MQAINRPRAVLIAVLLLVAGCGDDDASGAGPVAASVHLSGGLAGIEEVWTIDADGTVLGPEGSTGTVGAADLEAISAAVETADFFDLDEEYLPDDTCCDRFTYVITITRGGTTKSVTTIDAHQDAPDALFTLINLVLRTTAEAEAG